MVIDKVSDSGLQLLRVKKKMKEGEGECYPNRCPLNDSVTPF